MRQPNNKSLCELRTIRDELAAELDKQHPEDALRRSERIVIARANAEIARRVGTYNHATGYREARRGSQ